MKVRRFLIGAIVILILFFIFGGEDGISILMMTIICTAGISLVIYIPVAYVIGLVVEKSFFMITGKQDKEIITFTKNNSGLNSAEKAIFEYILNSRKLGIGDATIQMNLETNGWESEMISNAFNRVNIESSI